MKSFTYSLEVVEVRYNYIADRTEVELNLGPSSPGASYYEWNQWFRKHRLGKDY